MTNLFSLIKALWSNSSAEVVCDKIIESSIRQWANAVENYYETINKENVNTILPHTKCKNLSQIQNNEMKYHYGKNFIKLKKDLFLF